MWEHLTNLQLVEEWWEVSFNYPIADPRVAKTLQRLEEAWTERRKAARLDIDVVLPGGDDNTRREPEALG